MLQEEYDFYKELSLAIMNLCAKKVAPRDFEKEILSLTKPFVSSYEQKVEEC